MRHECPRCLKAKDKLSPGSKVIRHGSYYRTSDSRVVRRFRCLSCKFAFSNATFAPCYRQKKRQKNEILRRLLCSGVSQRRAAIILNIHRITVVRKFLYLSRKAALELSIYNQSQAKATCVEFDDMETFEHTKCKPLSITLAVEHRTRRILELRVASMSAKGLLVKKARRYGKRRDNRREKRRSLLLAIKDLIVTNAELKSDQNPYYAPDVKELLPNCRYKQYKGRRGSLGGQGELKKIRFDPLFSLNHTCAKFRADVNRLFRKTWCTTKRPDRLEAHLYLYANFHNKNFATSSI